MTHYMNLVPSAYAKIEAGTKTIELRLNDEKRQKISVGDEIVFTNTEFEDKKLRTRVLALHHFPSFAELYKNLPLQKCGYAEGEVADPDDMLSYYPRERELLYGALGIELKLI